MGLPTPSERVEFGSLPPAARRKFFSTAEYLRLAQGDRCHGLDHQSNLPKLPYQQSHFPWNRPSLQATDKPIHKKGRLKKTLYPRFSPNPRRTWMSQAAVLAACPNWQCFHSLPPKIQQSCFSNEERNWLHQISCLDEVLDAADEALFRFEKRRRMSESAETPSIPRSSTRCFGTSDIDMYDDIDEPDHALDACFGRLAEDEDLDLALDEYHAHVMDLPPKSQLERSLSSRRILPLFSGRPSFRPLSTVPSSPSLSQSSAASEAEVSTPNSNSETCHAQNPSHHESRSSTSSIDPSAQYYQDPEARLKLRVYLASPQKFDEAVEFGFPTWKRQGLKYPGRESTQSKTKKAHSGTFLEEDTTFPNGKPRQDQNTPRASADTPRSQSQHRLSALNNNRRQWLPSSKSYSRGSPGNREMTLKMTLTRPDLRTESATLGSSELSPDGFGSPTWESDMSERGLVKKMWRTLRRRK